MEKRVPHYDLVAIQVVVTGQKSAAFTKTALDNGRNMGLTTDEMLAVIASLTRQTFYKSMTTLQDHTVWQDVYHAPTPAADAYIKLTLRDHALVIQFKEK